MLLGRAHWSGTISGTQDSVEIREESQEIERFLYSAGCLTTSSQKTHSDWFLYSSG
jgi:hypothetical protein